MGFKAFKLMDMILPTIIPDTKLIQVIRSEVMWGLKETVDIRNSRFINNQDSMEDIRGAEFFFGFNCFLKYVHPDP